MNIIFKKTLQIICISSTVLLTSCLNSSNITKSPALEFRSVDITQQNEYGIKQWNLSSKIANVSNQNTIEALKPTFYIYRDGDDFLRITSDKAKLKEDNSNIMLSGDVIVEILSSNSRIILGAKNLKWKQQSQEIKLTGSAYLNYKSINIKSDKLTIIPKKDEIIFHKNTNINIPTGDDKYKVFRFKTDYLRYNMVNGDIFSNTDLKGKNSSSKASITSIQAKSLEGNINNNLLVFYRCIIEDSMIKTIAEECEITSWSKESQYKSDPLVGEDSNYINKLLYKRGNKPVRTVIKLK